ncbi:TPA: hypothetical protein ACGZ94_003429 [Elizabethkingia anophelis]
MGIFDDNKNKRIEYLEEERKKIWQRIKTLEDVNKSLQNQINFKASDAEKEAIQSSRKAAEYRNKSEQRLNEADEIVSNINVKLRQIDELVSAIQLSKNKAIESQSKTIEIEAEYNSTYEAILNKINTLESFLDLYPELDDKLEEINGFIDSVEENLSKSNVSLVALNKKKKDIDEFHQEVFGYIGKDDVGDEIEIQGIKSYLEDTYNDLENRMEYSEKEIKNLSESYRSSYTDFEKTHKDNYHKITTEIQSLLPNALTAGLSAAFSKKKEDEEKSSIELQKRFGWGIIMLILVSIIPLGVSIFFLVQGKKLDEVIYKIPRLVLAIIPMYIPVLWFTYSSNKKLNLSKRLIEEYAHKEVLSKTYEGLSKQISSLENDEQTSELKFKLLSSFLQVTSENPGKLISNYETSDHPIMEALEQSYKFQLAVDKLEGIPGLGKVAAILEAKSKKKLKEKQEIIEDALSIQKGLDKEETA